MSLRLIPYVSITPRYITTYARPEINRVRTKAQVENEQNLKQNDHRGEISYKASKRIKRAIDWMIFRAKPKKIYPHKKNNNLTFKLNFITLTLSAKQSHSDNQIKKEVLRPFLDYARKVWKIEDYLWRAEAQKNGNIHFHIVTDKYIPWSEIRNAWNRYQGRLGYVARYNEKFKGRTPNSTDVHSINKIKNLALYLSKYCAKESKYRKIEGKQWGLSHNLSKLGSAVELEWSGVTRELQRLYKVFKPKVFKSKYAHVMMLEASMWIGKGFRELEGILRDYMANIKQGKIVDKVVKMGEKVLKVSEKVPKMSKKVEILMQLDLFGEMTAI